MAMPAAAVRTIADVNPLMAALAKEHIKEEAGGVHLLQHLGLYAGLDDWSAVEVRHLVRLPIDQYADAVAAARELLEIDHGQEEVAEVAAVEAYVARPSAGA